MITSVQPNQHLQTCDKPVDEPKRESGEVASNHEAYKSNMQVILNTLEGNGVSLTNNYLTPKRFPVSEHELKGLEDITTHHQDSVFTDLYSKEETLMDKGRFLALAKDITNSRGVKTTDFELKEVTAGNLKTKPLEEQDYTKGAPFFLSCKTKHCDFPGAVGGNYPTAEYLSNQGTSVKVFNRSGDYVGHYNLWQQDTGDFCIGTIAMIDNHGISKYSPKDLKHLVVAQAISLLDNNKQAKSVSIGMGGHNLKNMFPAKFEKNTEGFVALGQLRHADLNLVNQNSVNQNMVTQLEKITGYKVSKESPVITEQDRIGMSPDQRKDFKNALVVVDRNNLEQQRNILNNYEQTKNQRSSGTRSKDKNSESLKLQRTEAFQSKESRLAFIETLLKNNPIQGCSLVSVNGMHALLRVDHPSNLEQTKQTLQDLTKSVQGLKVENGFRGDELRVKIPNITDLVSQKSVRATNWTSDIQKNIRRNAVDNFISKNQISGCETLSVNGADVLLRVSEEKKVAVMKIFSDLGNSMGITLKESPKSNQLRVSVKI
ncbi:hypothetical protein GCM10007938_20140 [Vibrio zhanjiangensis]|uniref:Uncharacterized protein n=1 Tax=Vibrio zhanjiangensis TaxID=1046128 RepID=A0ABQ6EZW0_9VIBR|nr:hypothetical protein [Vibrio zhanjiangensis]GLT18236.1 hypothetical protein GCM10007938_20140 [Vibrio zhanjiangensis]